MLPTFKITIGKDGEKPVIVIYFQGKRFRYYNGKSIGVNLNSSDHTRLLKAAFEIKLTQGWEPRRKVKVRKAVKVQEVLLTDIITEAVLRVDRAEYSATYKRDCWKVLRLWKVFERTVSTKGIAASEINNSHFEAFIRQEQWSYASQRVIKSTLSALLSKWKKNALQDIKIKRSKSIMHKPIDNLQAVFSELKDYNDNLYLACLLTYSCLLRPHIECRLLKWSDVNLEKGFISLSGKQNKSGRNRIVPLQERVKAELTLRLGEPDEYVLSRSKTPYNTSYLSTLWSRYRKYSKKVGSQHTLYSLRHSGSIKVFEKTGSLLKLQQVMGHSDMKVSLTYLRGLEVKQLDVEDLPEL